MVTRLTALGLTEPLPIQAATIPDALAGRDVCGRAPTGSGKTLAYSLPLLNVAPATKPGRPRALVLVPTRELADQVRTVLASLLGSRRDRVVAIYGGTGYEGQRRALRRGVDIVVACPGRLEDLLARRELQLGDVRLVVLDEADRMVDMGFLPPVRRLLDLTSADRQVLLFSATIGPEVEGIIRRYQRDPVRHEVAAEEADADQVTHLFWRVERGDRVSVTRNLVTEHGQAFVFCRTKHGADRTTRQLRAAGIDAVAIHGDRSQSQRTHALAAFTAGRAQALVATDVVARGIHIDDVPCVVHFDPPADATTYVHRSGRTGRVGREGIVVSLVPDELRGDIRAMQRALGLPTELGLPFTEGSMVATLPENDRPAPARHHKVTVASPPARPAGRGRRRPGRNGTSRSSARRG